MLGHKYTLLCAQFYTPNGHSMVVQESSIQALFNLYCIALLWRFLLHVCVRVRACTLRSVCVALSTIVIVVCVCVPSSFHNWHVVVGRRSLFVWCSFRMCVRAYCIKRKIRRKKSVSLISAATWQTVQNVLHSSSLGFSLFIYSQLEYVVIVSVYYW